MRDGKGSPAAKRCDPSKTGLLGGPTSLEDRRNVSPTQLRRLIASIPQGELAALQIRLEIWSGRPRIDARIFNGPARERRPTIRGFCIRPCQLDQIIDALLAAKREAIALGWIVGDSGPA